MKYYILKIEDWKRTINKKTNLFDAFVDMIFERADFSPLEKKDRIDRFKTMVENSSPEAVERALEIMKKDYQ